METLNQRFGNESRVILISNKLQLDLSYGGFQQLSLQSLLEGRISDSASVWTLIKQKRLDEGNSTWMVGKSKKNMLLYKNTNI